MLSYFIFCLREYWYLRFHLFEVIFLFLSIAALFGFVLPLSQAELSKISIGIIWSTIFLSMLLGAERFFIQDYKDGTLELLVFSPLPLFFTVSIRIFAHCIVNSLLLCILLPSIALMFYLPLKAFFVVVITGIIGSLIFSYLSALASSLLLKVDQGGFLSFILLFPLSISVVIFATDASYSVLEGRDFSFQLNILFIELLVNVLIIPWLIIASIKNSLRNL